MAAEIKMCKLLTSLWILCAANCLSVAHGQVECVPEGQEQCHKNYYCDFDFRCKKCAPCENVETDSNFCPKSLTECGVCLDGYEFRSPGKCVAPNTIGTILFWISASTSTVLLAIVFINVALCSRRKYRNESLSCQTYNVSKRDINLTTVVTEPPTLKQPSAPPPYWSSPQPQHNPAYSDSLDNGVSKPLLQRQELEQDFQQMSRPFSNTVRLPPSLNWNNVDDYEENYNTSEHDGDAESVADDSDAHSMDMLRRADAEERLPPPQPQPLQDLPMVISNQIQDCNSTVEIVEASDSDSESGHSRQKSPADLDEDACQIVNLQVVNVNNVYPILNMQGNKVRR